MIYESEMNVHMESFSKLLLSHRHNVLYNLYNLLVRCFQEILILIFIGFIHLDEHILDEIRFHQDGPFFFVESDAFTDEDILVLTKAHKYRIIIERLFNQITFQTHPTFSIH